MSEIYQHVDTLKISVTPIDGVKVDVIKFELSVAINSIPSIVLDVVPVESKSNAGKNSVHKVNFEEITSLYKKLSKKTVDNSVKATVTITQECHDIFNDTQKIVLENWILTDAGLSSVSPGSTPTLVLVLKHRIVELERNGAIYELINNSVSATRIFNSVSGTDMISFMSSVYEKFKGTQITFYEPTSVENGGTTAEFKEVVTSYRKGLKLPKDYLECKCSLFLNHLTTSATARIKEALGSLMSPEPFGGSTWIRLVSEICPTCLAQITPTYDKPNLWFEPYSPWQKSMLNVFSDRVTSIELPTQDLDPIFGTAVQKDKLVSYYVTGNNVRISKPKKEDLTFSFYFPKQVISDSAKRIGRIEFVQENPVIEEARVMDYGGATPYEKSTSGASTVDASSNNIRDGDLAKLNGAYAESMFQGMYRHNCKAAITAIPTFTDNDGKMIYPGRVIEVNDPDSQKTIFYGFIARIVTRGSNATEGSSGSTCIEMTSARPAEADSSLIQEGSENKCYSSYDFSAIYQ